MTLQATSPAGRERDLLHSDASGKYSETLRKQSSVLGAWHPVTKRQEHGMTVADDLLASSRRAFLRGTAMMGTAGMVLPPWARRPPL